jgi:hypothetical protein
MTHDVQAIREDLAFMRALAQEGRRAPLLIGRGLVVAGLVFGAASVFCWAVEVRLLALPYWWLGAIWPIAIAVFVPSVRWWRTACTDARPGASAVTNQAVLAVMQGLGFALLALLFASWALAWTLHTHVVFALFPSVVLAIYGAAWSVAARLSDVAWLRVVPPGCFLAAVALGFAAPYAWGYLAFAVALLAVTTLPGALLMKLEPSLEV